MEIRRKVDSWLHCKLHFSSTPRRSTSRQHLTLHIAHATADYWIKLEELPEHLLRVDSVSSAVSMKQCQLQALADRCQLSNDGCREVGRWVVIVGDLTRIPLSVKSAASAVEDTE
ncbi:hypothetical protein ECG_06217 [Echinococcus granulosus]|nr:hypothetical protein ECG_06217 [Echinococcus granulosus]